METGSYAPVGQFINVSYPDLRWRSSITSALMIWAGANVHTGEGRGRKVGA